MRAPTINVRESTGSILCCPIFARAAKKLLVKGHLIKEEDVRLLETEGLDEVGVTELEEGAVAEDDAVAIEAREMGCGSLEVSIAASGPRT